MRERKWVMFGIFGQAVLLGIIFIPAYLYKFLFAARSSDVSAVSTVEDPPANRPTESQPTDSGIEMSKYNSPEVVTAVAVEATAPPIVVAVVATSASATANDPYEKREKDEPDTVIHDLEENTHGTVAVTGVSSAAI